MLTGPVEIERKGQQRVVEVTGNLTGERDLGAVVADLRERLPGIGCPGLRRGGGRRGPGRAGVLQVARAWRSSGRSCWSTW